MTIFEETKGVMKELLDLKNIEDYNKRVGYKALHPLISVIDLSKANYQDGARALALRFGFYAIFLKQGADCTLKYGRNNYDYEEGTLVFIGPGQLVDISSDGQDYQPSGTAILFHPDLFLGTPMAQKIKEYSFFSYEVFEALHLSDRERQVILDCTQKIEFELQQGIDKHSKHLIISNIELFLGYCNRFYDRQFITRDTINQGVLAKFDKSLNDYFKSDRPLTLGTPTVGYFADQLHLSPNYFGDLVKKETGKSALDYIQTKLIDEAKERVFNYNKSVSEIAYELGFKYPQHFSRLFKQKVGHSPNEFRQMN